MLIIININAFIKNYYSQTDQTDQMKNCNFMLKC